MYNKDDILVCLYGIIDDKIAISSKAIASATEARDGDTKSSAGDKYETGREMMQIEIEKNKLQLAHAKHLKDELCRISVQKKYIKAAFGSLVITNHGNYFLSIGIGKMIVTEAIVFAISLDSPLGKLFLNKHVGDKILFQSKEIIIIEIV